jgi:hypothetical protein
VPRFARNSRLIAWSCWLTLLVTFGAALHVVLPPEPRWCLVGCGPVDLTLAEQGRFLAWQNDAGDASGSAILHDLHTGEPIRTFFAGAGGPGGLRCAPAGNWIARHDSVSLCVAAVADGAEHTITFPQGVSIAAVEFAQDGEVMAVSLHSKVDDKQPHHRLALIETATGKRLAELPGALSHVSSARGGKLLLLAVEVGKQPILKAWDVRARRWAFQLDRTIPNWTMGPDGRTLVSHAHPPGSRQWMICDAELGTVDFAGPENSGLRHLSYSADGRRLAIKHGQVRAPRVDVFDLDTHQRLLNIDDVWYPQIALSPDGRRLALQTVVRPGDDDAGHAVCVIDVDTGRQLWQREPIPVSPFWIPPNLTFGPDGRSIVVYRHAPHRAEILDTETGAMLATLPLAGADVQWTSTSVMVAPDHRTQVVQTTIVPPMRPAWWHESLDSLFPNDLVQEFIVVDVASRRVVGRLQVPDGHETILLDSGRLLLTIQPEAGTRPGRVCCWDLPAAAPWLKIIGMPAALGALIAAAVWWRNRRRPTAS